MATPANWTDFSNLDAERAIALGNRYLPAAVTLVLVLLLGWQLARLVWLLVPASPLGDPVTAAPPPGSATAGSVQGRQTADVEAIASAHLFGEASAEDVANLPAPAPTEELEETRLALTLKGTMAGSNERLTVAIIADNRNEEKVYTIGDAIVPGATLHAVYRDQVVLNRNGALESLKLPNQPRNWTTVHARRCRTISRQRAFRGQEDGTASPGPTHCRKVTSTPESRGRRSGRIRVFTPSFME